MLNGKGRLCNGAHGYRHQLHGIVVSGNSVGAELSAAAAAMYQRPLAVFAHPHSHCVHYTSAVGGSVSGLVIDVQTGKAVGAVVAVVGSRSLRGAYPAAYLAGKGLIAGFVSVVLVIFRIMLHISSKRLSFGRRMTYAVK